MLGLSDEESKEEIECPWCKWKGTKGELIRKYVYSDPESWMALAGREGYEYSCPNKDCQMILIHDYWKMS